MICDEEEYWCVTAHFPGTLYPFVYAVTTRTGKDVARDFNIVYTETEHTVQAGLMADPLTEHDLHLSLFFGGVPDDYVIFNEREVIAVCLHHSQCELSGNIFRLVNEFFHQPLQSSSFFASSVKKKRGVESDPSSKSDRDTRD